MRCGDTNMRKEAIQLNVLPGGVRVSESICSNIYKEPLDLLLF